MAVTGYLLSNRPWNKASGYDILKFVGATLLPNIVRKEVNVLAIFLTVVLLPLVVSIAANVISELVLRWLDRKRKDK